MLLLWEPYFENRLCVIRLGEGGSLPLLRDLTDRKPGTSVIKPACQLRRGPRAGKSRVSGSEGRPLCAPTDVAGILGPAGRGGTLASSPEPGPSLDAALKAALAPTARSPLLPQTGAEDGQGGPLEGRA